MSGWLLLAWLAGAAPGGAPALDVPAGLPYPADVSTAAAHRRADGGAYLLRTRYDRAAWSGDVERVDLHDGGQARTVTWSAAARMPAQRDRAIYTSVLQGHRTTTVPFTRAAMPHGLFDPSLLDYLRGERSGEGRGWRRRAGVLGAIVRSEPLVVGPPVHGDGPGYAAFQRQHRARPELAYVAANDGMLHAFGLHDGIEQFAYVPRRLLGQVGELAGDGYVPAAHLDASPGAGDVRVHGEWRTVLASGYGMGARGLFALDVTDPARFGAGEGELWQFTEQDDALVGHIHARPAIARLRVGGTAAAPLYRYFAVVSSGINNYAGDAPPHGALYLLGLDKQGATPWQHGADYFRLLAPASLAQRANALGPPALVRGPDGALRHAYAGDLQGNLWRFDFTSLPWPAQGTLLFTAKAGGAHQPITAAPAVAHAPGGYLVLFGTGRVIETGDLDPGASGTQSFYAVFDAPGRSAPAVSREHMARRTLSFRDGALEAAGPDIDYAVHQGWFFDFPQAGERSIASPPLASGIVVVRAVLPPATPGAGLSERRYILHALTGMAAPPAGAVSAAPPARKTVKPYAFPAPLVMSYVAPRAGAAGAARAVTRFSFIPVDGDAMPEQVEAATPAGRLSWREIHNWQTLHDASQ